METLYPKMRITKVQRCSYDCSVPKDRVAVLQAIRNQWKNTPPNWGGSDPCNWDGIECRNSRVISITLSSIGLAGQLPGDIVNLSELETLDLLSNTGLIGTLPTSIGNLKKLSNLILAGCSFTGLIPDSIGSLVLLRFLSLNTNGFSGRIPPSIGNLINLYWLDLAENQLTGTIPVSTRSSPGLDNLVNTKHFHFGKNQLSGEIPSQLFNANLTLLHVIFSTDGLGPYGNGKPMVDVEAALPAKAKAATKTGTSAKPNVTLVDPKKIQIQGYLPWDSRNGSKLFSKTLGILYKNGLTRDGGFELKWIK